ncbi:serine hydrolase domain-containing protein [Paenibacillus sp. GCM10027627]|uniref:serine hydrolase domain-containing protein n=1 Tax=unclassified Paenibacillus TaxID=185978 RepID=UPI003644AEDF
MEEREVSRQSLSIEKAEKLSRLENAINTEYENINGIVAATDDGIAYEQYFQGYGPDHAHHIASVTKSILSALIGIAMDEGHIHDVDQKVLNFFPDYEIDDANTVINEVTLRHLLTMTAPYPFAHWHEPLDQMCMQPDWIKHTLGLLGKGGSLGDFKYSTAGAHLLSTVITRVTGRSARQYANEQLFRPIGMREIPDYEMSAFGFDDLFGSGVKGWVHDPAGHSTGGWGLTLTPRDMARFGLLYLNRGEWKGKLILSSRWIEQSIAMTANQYGYLWWLREEEGLFSFSAIGDGGNMICCIPKHHLVVAIASEFTPNPRDRWTLIRDFVIPAVLD